MAEINIQLGHPSRNLCEVVAKFLNEKSKVDEYHSDPYTAKRLVFLQSECINDPAIAKEPGLSAVQYVIVTRDSMIIDPMYDHGAMGDILNGKEPEKYLPVDYFAKFNENYHDARYVHLSLADGSSPAGQPAVTLTIQQK
jgi:hypothetical protein